MTQEEILAKAAELGASLGCSVRPFAFTHKGKQIVGFLREPSRDVKMSAMDKVFSGSIMKAGEEILRVCLLDQSSPEILSNDTENDVVFITSCRQAANMLEIYSNELKKNADE